MIDQVLNSAKEERFENAVKSEKPIRSITKAVSWRVIGTLDTIVISWIITGEFTMALTIGSIEIITKMALYFFHERLWNVIKWGKE